MFFNVQSPLPETAIFGVFQPEIWRCFYEFQEGSIVLCARKKELVIHIWQVLYSSGSYASMIYAV